MQSTNPQSFSRRRNPPSSLRIDTPVHASTTVLSSNDSPMTSAQSSDSESVLLSPKKSRSLNMKKLSLDLPSARSSTHSLSIVVSGSQPTAVSMETRRRPSVVSLPPASTATSLFRQDEGGSPSIPYADGPIEILPGIWLGSEDNARDWRGLVHRGIKSVLNVAKEVVCPFDSFVTTKALRSTVSTSNLAEPSQDGKPVYYPAHVPSGRPGMHYLKLPWSHGQPDLVNVGLPTAFEFVDESLTRGDGILIHCQCGISRSGTLVIALVMRAAVKCSPSVPAEVWALKGMQGAYSYVKEKSKHVGPNMSLIYQLLDYERSLKGNSSSSPASDRLSIAAIEDEEWGRRRAMLDESGSDAEDDRNSTKVVEEARALDKEMADRILTRKTSASSVVSSVFGAGSAWKSRFNGRKRAGSVASNLTSGSLLSEDLVEEDEEGELLGVGGGFDEESNGTSPESQYEDDMASRLPFTPHTARHSSLCVPPSAPASKSTFTLPRGPTSVQSSLDSTPRATTRSKNRHRPVPLSILPPVPASPIAPPVHTARVRTESRKPDRPPPYLRNKRLFSQYVPTPSPTLFVFPPTLSDQAPSTMILTPTAESFVPFPTVAAPSGPDQKRNSRRMSLIGVAPPATPTTAYSRVDARGWIGRDL